MNFDTDTPITYPAKGEITISLSKVRQDSAWNWRKAKTYRSRALCLVKRLSEERVARKTAERVADCMMAHACKVEQENADLRALLRRAYAALAQADTNIRIELDRPDPNLLHELGNACTPYPLPAGMPAGKG